MSGEDDVICVEPGVHPTNVAVEGVALRLLGTKGPQFTTLAGTGQASVLDIRSVPEAISSIRGLTITGGNAAITGGGIFANNAALSIEHVVVAGNVAGHIGGGIVGRSSEGGQDLVLRDVEIIGNSSLFGGEPSSGRAEQ